MMRSSCLIFALVPIFCIIDGISAYGSGAPPGACDDLTPGHGSQLAGTTPFSIKVKRVEANEFQVTLSGGGKTFKGFILQARQVNGNNKALGSFDVSSPALSHAFECESAKDTATHSSGSSKTSLTFSWSPPANFNENIKFHATVAESRSDWWKGITSDEISVNSGGPTTQPPATEPSMALNVTESMPSSSAVPSVTKTTVTVPSTTSKAASATRYSIFVFVLTNLVMFLRL